jgi:hypothetical protein
MEEYLKIDYKDKVNFLFHQTIANKVYLLMSLFVRLINS